MATQSLGRYPFKDALCYSGFQTGGWLSLVNNYCMNPPNNSDMWQDWYLSPDGLGFGTFYRWDSGTGSWRQCTNFNVHYF